MNYSHFIFHVIQKHFSFCNLSEYSINFGNIKCILNDWIFFCVLLCKKKIMNGIHAQDKEDADYVEWLKGQTELEEREGVKDMVSR